MLYLHQAIIELIKWNGQEPGRTRVNSDISNFWQEQKLTKISQVPNFGSGGIRPTF